MSIIAWLIVGLIAGFIGSKLVNKTGEGFVLDIVLGVIGAFVTLATLGAVYSGAIDIGPGPQVSAGSGSAPTNTFYKQPVIGQMNTGATATWTPPGTQPRRPSLR